MYAFVLNSWNFIVGFICTFSYVNLTFSTAQYMDEIIFNCIRLVASIIGGVLTSLILTWFKKKYQNYNKKNKPLKKY